MGPRARLRQFSLDLSTPGLMGGEFYVSRSGAIFSFGRTQPIHLFSAAKKGEHFEEWRWIVGRETERPNFDRIILSQLGESTFVFCWAKLLGEVLTNYPIIIKVIKRSTFPIFHFFPCLSDFVYRLPNCSLDWPSLQNMLRINHEIQWVFCFRIEAFLRVDGIRSIQVS